MLEFKVGPLMATVNPQNGTGYLTTTARGGLALTGFSIREGVVEFDTLTWMPMEECRKIKALIEQEYQEPAS